jgi:hypothetical protein
MLGGVDGEELPGVIRHAYGTAIERLRGRACRQSHPAIAPKRNR